MVKNCRSDPDSRTVPVARETVKWCMVSNMGPCAKEQASNRVRATPEHDPPGSEGVGHPTGAGVGALRKYGRPTSEG